MLSERLIRRMIKRTDSSKDASFTCCRIEAGRTAQQGPFYTAAEHNTTEIRVQLQSFNYGQERVPPCAIIHRPACLAIHLQKIPSRNVGLDRIASWINV